jgi:hypothetical protein
MDQVSPDLLDKVFLGRDTHEDGNRFVGKAKVPSETPAKQDCQQKQEGRKNSAASSAVGRFSRSHVL